MLCHEHQCIFVHIPKCGGQSIEQVFLRRRGLSWRDRHQLLMRYNADPRRGPPRLAHLAADQYVACGHVSESLFASYYSFAFVRNPWDRAVSLYKHLGYAPIVDFATFVRELLATELWQTMYWFVRPQADFLFGARGEQMVAFVGRFERLQLDFQEVCHALGLPPTLLPHANAARERRRALAHWRRAAGELVRRPHCVLRHLRQQLTAKRQHAVAQPKTNVTTDYRSYYDQRTQTLVAELYALDIEQFGYEFDTPRYRQHRQPS